MDYYQQILTKYWGYSVFRPLQEEIIKSVMAGNDTLGLMPTGGGKSITFQVPALVKDGICVVVTPLIALMKDQVEELERKKIKALYINSGMTKREINFALDNCIFGDYKFLYVSPERLVSELFLTKLQEMNVNLIAVDESHCISQWGYDFRPSYLRIAELRKTIPDIPILALTATATPEVVDDIQEKLSFKKKNVLQKSFERKNLIYLVREVEDKLKYLLKIMNNSKGSGIVYVRSRKKTKEIADFLKLNKISAEHYHAGLGIDTRNYIQHQWKNDQIRVMVATNAFGMGIDKANVRVVVHMDLPNSLEEYFQEAGRAGRDTQRAYGVLLFNNSDSVQAKTRLAKSFPSFEKIKSIYKALGNYFQITIGGGKDLAFDFNLFEFSSNYKLDMIAVYNSLKILQGEGYFEFTEELNNPSKIHFLVKRDDLYKFQVQNINFDGFIKLLLRSYTGVFSTFVRIDEKFLAKRASIKQQEVYNFLVNLQKQKIIEFIPQKKTPQVFYLMERVNENELFLSQENYHFRKEKYSKRINAILNYSSSNNKCRSQLLLNYFGEKDPDRCGKCDVCNRRNELELSKYEFDKILEVVKNILKKEKTTMDTLIDNVSYSHEKVIKVIDWLLDNKKIKIYEDGNLSWLVN
ncbi:MAG: RecQ family ATP-dependent DNA helicase [Bacteroidetes bacterium]|nr:RecQ family ATP-dependent DNA helicase [Bacteroidota bacterium]MBT6686338.1 RecQ family ATP-dependent DNA helicase [Bacteroidota bacterium]MBT7142171.1 RecQ family ATP-dependent DNA helicase [Bacteroidota bacterium]MBT7490474.1 RecQ family ATP-dependent DNA helicase [Bacteroidota bacterium]